jgi:hypothetical protein
MVVGIRAPKIVALYVKECTKGVPQAAPEHKKKEQANKKIITQIYQEQPQRIE